MRANRKVALILILLTVFLGLLLSNAAAEKAKTAVNKKKISAEKTLIEKKPEIKKLKKLVDLDIAKIRIDNGLATGVSHVVINPLVYNLGPSTASGVKVCVKPIKPHGRKWCESYDSLANGDSTRRWFIIYQDDAIVKVTASSSQVENNIQNNACVVKLPTPIDPTVGEGSQQYWVDCKFSEMGGSRQRSN